MKNEDRIVELLAESLKRQDQHSELLKAIVDRQERTEQQQRASTERIIASVDALTDIIKIWMERTKRIDNHEERISALERRKA